MEGKGRRRKRKTPTILGTFLIQGNLECFPESDACCWGLVSRKSVCEGSFLRLLVGPKSILEILVLGDL